MDKVYIYMRFLALSPDGAWRKYYKRPMTIEKAKAKLAKLRRTQACVQFCMAVDGRIVQE